MAANAARLCSALNATIYLRESDSIVVHAQSGPLGGTPIGGRRALNINSVTGRAVLESRTIHLPDPLKSDQYPESREIALRFGHGSTLAVPLHRNKTAIGDDLGPETDAVAVQSGTWNSFGGYACRKRIRLGERVMEYADWLRRVRSGSTEAFAFATFLVVVATLVRWGLGFLGDDVFVFAGYYPVVLFASYVGGAAVGSFATVLSAVIAWWAFIPPRFAFFPLTVGVETKVLAFLFASALIVWGADHYRRLRKRFEDEEKFRKLAVEELAHRLKNKIATIQSIVSFRLRKHPQARDEIMRSLIALSATDDLILATQGQGASIRDILSAELGPYDASRVSMAGPDILLPPKLALTMALLTHELATNAAKHGALSCGAGQLSIGWPLSDERLNLEWRECEAGGPATLAGRTGPANKRLIEHRQ